MILSVISIREKLISSNHISGKTVQSQAVRSYLFKILSYVPRIISICSCSYVRVDNITELRILRILAFNTIGKAIN